MVSNMTRHCKMSFVIPTYQEEKYIEKTLEALSMLDCEIIVVDSGHDKTFNIARKYADKVLKLSQKGVSKARNFGAIKSSGDILIFLDADVIFPKLNDINLGDNAALISYTRCSADSPLIRLYIKIESFFIKHLTQLAVYFYARCDALIVRRDAFLKAGMFNEEINMMEVTELLLRLSKIGKIGVLPVPVQETGRRFKKSGIVSRYCFKWWRNLVSFYLTGKPFKNYHEEFGVVR